MVRCVNGYYVVMVAVFSAILSFALVIITIILMLLDNDLLSY